MLAHTYLSNFDGVEEIIHTMFLFLKRQYVPFLEKNVEVSGVFLESRIEIS